MDDDARPFGLVDLFCLLLVVACAAGTRAGYVGWCGGGSVTAFEVQAQGPVRQVGDAASGGQTELQALAANLRDERWFGCLAPLADEEEETAHASPGYPWLLSLAGRVHQRPAALVRWTQCWLGVVTVVACFFFARRAFGSVVIGTIAG
jgi:hypothetical protein